MTDHDNTRKPVNYDELFPGRFLKAGLFVGKNTTFTVRDYDVEKLPQDDNKEKTRGIISFRETELQLALNSTNGQCLKAMFGATLANWVGKRVTFCAEKDRDPGGGGMVDAIRVFGSPDIDRDMSIEVKLPRRKPKTRTLKCTRESGRAAPQAKQNPTTSKPAGDMEDAIARLVNAPSDELDMIADELRQVYRWTSSDAAKIKATLERLRSPVDLAPADPNNDGR